VFSPVSTSKYNTVMVKFEDLPDDIVIQIFESIHDFNVIFIILPSLCRRIRWLLKYRFRWRTAARFRLTRSLIRPRALAAVLKRVYSIDLIMIYSSGNVTISESDVIIIAKSCGNLRGFYTNALRSISPAFFSRLNSVCGKLTRLYLVGDVKEISAHVPGMCRMLDDYPSAWANTLQSIMLPNGKWITPGFIDQFLKMCTSLTYLSVWARASASRPPVKTRHLPHLQVLDSIARHLPHLRVLEIRSPIRVMGCTESIYRILGQCVQLHTLKITCGINSDFGVVPGLPCCASLVFINISDSDITDDGLIALITASPEIKDLGIARCSNLTNVGVLSALSLFRARRLYVGKILNILQIIADTTTTLKSLSLYDAETDLETWKRLIKANPGIIEIFFDGMEITDNILSIATEGGVKHTAGINCITSPGWPEQIFGRSSYQEYFDSLPWSDELIPESLDMLSEIPH
jgi:hypothetical protein